jgi:hypothetical protein
VRTDEKSELRGDYFSAMRRVHADGRGLARYRTIKRPCHSLHHAKYFNQSTEYPLFVEFDTDLLSILILRFDSDTSQLAKGSVATSTRYAEKHRRNEI